jgi:small ligand-binding sensory domain FIST
MRFRYGHASHTDWRVATELCLAQVLGSDDKQKSGVRGNLGVMYFTEALAPYASDILLELRMRTGVVDWVGSVGIGIIATGVEYLDEPALSIMLGLFPVGSVRVFSGLTPPPALDACTPSGALAASSALVHADPLTADLSDLLIDMSGKLASGRLFGGLASSRRNTVLVANGCLSGGLSGAVFSSEVELHTGVTQGCHPLAGVHTVTRGNDNLIAELDGRPALDVLLEDCNVTESAGGAATVQREMLVHTVRHTFCGLLSTPASRWGDALVRPLIGVDPQHRVLAIGDTVVQGMSLQFCKRDARSARLDLVRVCTELRALCEERPGGMADVRGAIYISCLGRGSSLFGEESAELRLIRAQLGELPLVGFFANGEIAAYRLYGYTGVLTLFF